MAIFCYSEPCADEDVVAKARSMPFNFLLTLYPFLRVYPLDSEAKCMTSGYPEAAMLERPMDRIHENRGVPEEHQLF